MEKQDEESSIYDVVVFTDFCYNKMNEEWAFEHEQVCGFIRQFVEDNVYNHICNETHLNKMQRIMGQLLGMGINFDNEILTLMVLASLPELWETLKISLTNSTPNGVVNIEFVKNDILNEKIVCGLKGVSSTQSDILIVNSRGLT